MTYVPNIEGYYHALNRLGRYKSLGIDIETYVKPQWKGIGRAVDPHTSAISLVGLTSPPPEEEVFLLDIILLERAHYDVTPLLDLLQSRDELVVFYGVFEAMFIRHYWGLLLENWWDVKVAQAIIGNATSSKFFRSVSSYRLKDVVRDWTGVRMDKTLGAQDWSIRPQDSDESWWQESLQYLEGDIKWLYKIKALQHKVITDPLPTPGSLTGAQEWGLECADTLELENKFVSSVACMILDGLPFSESINTLFQGGIYNKASHTGEVLRVGGEVCRHLGLSTEPTLGAPYPIPTAKSLTTLNSHEKLKHLLMRKTGLALDSTQTKVLIRLIDLLELQANGDEVAFADEDEQEIYKEITLLESSAAYQYSVVSKLIVEYKRLFKQSGMNLAKYANPASGRIHPITDANGAATGRCSSSSPNGQNISSRTKLTVSLPKGEYLKMLGYTGWKHPNSSPQQS